LDGSTMFEEIETRFDSDLQHTPAVGRDAPLDRAARRSIGGIAFLAQRTRLVLDQPDAAGKASYPCRIFDFSGGGFGVICHAVGTAAEAFQPGARMTLEAWDSKRSRVEIRWINNGRIGLKCVDTEPG